MKYERLFRTRYHINTLIVINNLFSHNLSEDSYTIYRENIHSPYIINNIIWLNNQQTVAHELLSLKGIHCIDTRHVSHGSLQNLKSISILQPSNLNFFELTHNFVVIIYFLLD